LLGLIATGVMMLIVPSAFCQDENLPRAEFDGLTYREMTRRVFQAERGTIGLLSFSNLLTEGYVQSLGHLQNHGMDKTIDEDSEYVLDDKYFLSAVNLSRRYDEKVVERPLFARRAGSRYIQRNEAGEEPILPLGLLSMFFVDLDSFDADTYSLIYETKERIADVNCLLFSVKPNSSRSTGLFVGHIWVDPSSARIVRINGIFTSFKSRKRYFHFDSWRQRVGSLWFPTVAYFDERRTAGSDGNLINHYRGYTLLWQHQRGASGAITQTENNLVLPAAQVQRPKNDILARLDEDGLLASPGPVEELLDRLVRQIAPRIAQTQDPITCRVLLTTPTEIFSTGNVIIVSRGLMNIVPDESVLAVLLARQIAQIELGQSHPPLPLFNKSIFELKGSRDFPGFGIKRPMKEEIAADREALALLDESPYRDDIRRAKRFLFQARRDSHRLPSLLIPRFGPRFIPIGTAFELSSQAVNSLPKENLVHLRNRFNVTWNGQIFMSEQKPDQSVFWTESKLDASHFSIIRHK